MDINYTLSFNVVRKGLSDKKFLSLSYHNRNHKRHKNLRANSYSKNIVGPLSNAKNNDVHPYLWTIKYTNRINSTFQLLKKARKRRITKNNYVTTIHPSMYTLHIIADMQKDMSKKGRWCSNPRTGKYVLIDDIKLQSFGVYHL